MPVPSLVKFGQPREDKELVAHAPGKCQVILLGKIDCGSDLDREVRTGKSFVKFFSVEWTSADP
jgi:hypothetical protein